MFEKALKGNNYYWMWLAFLGFFIAIAAVCYLRQYFYGLGITGMSREQLEAFVPGWPVSSQEAVA